MKKGERKTAIWPETKHETKNKNKQNNETLNNNTKYPLALSINVKTVSRVL